MFKDAKRVDVIETTPDKVESYIEAYKRGEIIDLPPLLESEEIKEITNKELATLTGLHVKTIREVRKGLTATRYSTLRKIYKVLKEI